MKKQIIVVALLIVSLAAYTTYNSRELTAQRETFVKTCDSNDGIYAEGVLTDIEWRPAGCTAKTCDQTKEGRGVYRFTFVRHTMEAPTLATLPGIKADLDAPRRRLEHGKSYSLCMKKDHVLIDYYKSF